VRAQVSEPVTSRKAVQADIEPQSHDDSTFTEQDFELLLANALDIQNVLVGRYQESWIKWAKFRNSHTAAEWRSFYERRVLPVVLQEGDGFERPESQRGDEWVEFWRNQGQPIDVLPYKSAYEVPSTSPNVAEKASTSAEQDKEMDDVVEQVGEVGENVLLESAKRKLPTPQDVVEEEPAQKRPRTATPPPKPVKDIAPVQSVPQLIAEGVVSVSSNRPHRTTTLKKRRRKKSPRIKQQASCNVKWRKTKTIAISLPGPILPVSKRRTACLRRREV
jgi:hypothetical protein